MMGNFAFRWFNHETHDSVWKKVFAVKMQSISSPVHILHTAIFLCVSKDLTTLL